MARKDEWETAEEITERLASYSKPEGESDDYIS